MSAGSQIHRGCTSQDAGPHHDLEPSSGRILQDAGPHHDLGPSSGRILQDTGAARSDACVTRNGRWRR